MAGFTPVGVVNGSRSSHAPRVTMAICGEKRTGGAPPGGAHEWNQRFEFGGLLQDFMDHPLQITLTSTGDKSKPTSAAACAG